jgi:hypothetical protein
MTIEADPRRAPEDFLPEARRVLAEKAEPPHPADLAAFDQQEAASKFITNQIARSPAVEKSSRGMPTERSLALLLAMEAAGKRRTRHHCPHIRWDTPLALQGAFVLVSAGIVACNAGCALSLLESTGGFEDDGRCDVCDSASTIFSEDSMSHGGLILTANLCPSCHRWLEDES